MKISVSRSSGNIEPNFAIIAETVADRVFLQAFDEVHAKYKKLAVGGTTYEIGKGITAFNFHIDKSASNVSGWSDEDMISFANYVRTWEMYPANAHTTIEDMLKKFASDRKPSPSTPQQEWEVKEDDYQKLWLKVCDHRDKLMEELVSLRKSSMWTKEDMEEAFCIGTDSEYDFHEKGKVRIDFSTWYEDYRNREVVKEDRWSDPDFMVKNINQPPSHIKGEEEWELYKKVAYRTKEEIYETEKQLQAKEEEVKKLVERNALGNIGMKGLEATIKSQQVTLNEQGKYIARLEEQFKANGETIERLKVGLEKIIRIANGGNRLDDIAWRNAYHTANDLIQSLNK